VVSTQTFCAWCFGFSSIPKFDNRDYDFLWCFSVSSSKWQRSTRKNKQTKKQTNSVALSPQANYTDWSTAICRRNLVPTFVDRGVSRGQRGRSPTVVNLSFLDRSSYFFFQVAPHLSSRVLSGPRSRHTATQKNLVAPGIEPGTSGLAARKPLSTIENITWPVDSNVFRYQTKLYIKQQNVTEIWI
jgi:hypothetical protein